MLAPLCPLDPAQPEVRGPEWAEWGRRSLREWGLQGRLSQDLLSGGPRLSPHAVSPGGLLGGRCRPQPLCGKVQQPARGRGRSSQRRGFTNKLANKFPRGTGGL